MLAAIMLLSCSYMVSSCGTCPLKLNFVRKGVVYAAMLGN